MIDAYHRVKIDAFRYDLKRLQFTAAFTYKGNIVLHAGKLSIVRHRGVEALRFLMESLYVYPCISVDFPNPIISSRMLFRFDYSIGILTDTVSLSHQFQHFNVALHLHYQLFAFALSGSMPEVFL